MISLYLCMPLQLTRSEATWDNHVHVLHHEILFCLQMPVITNATMRPVRTDKGRAAADNGASTELFCRCLKVLNHLLHVRGYQ